MKCERDSLMYMSKPPQNKCKNCGKFWFCDKETPECSEPMTKEEEKRFYDKVLKPNPVLGETPKSCSHCYCQTVFVEQIMHKKCCNCGNKQSSTNYGETF